MTENNLTILVGMPKLNEILHRICTLQEVTDEILRASPVMISILIEEGILELIEEGKYKVNVSEEQLKAAIEKAEDKKTKEEIELKKAEEKKQAEEEKLPDDLFSVIEGYDDIKEIFIKSLKASTPVHILLVGKPGTAKTVFLMELERLGGIMILGGTSTKVGIRDILLEELPRILLIDEINEINSGKELTALLTWMESQRVVVAKAGDYRDKKGKGWVFGACNSTRNIPDALLSRFMRFYFKDYSEEEFIKVGIAILTKREGIDEDLARYISSELAHRKYRDVRDAIKVARLSSTNEEAKRIMDTMVKYKK